MIQDFFGLRTDPFSLSPDLEFLFQSSAHEEAVAHLAYGLEQDEDIILICGDIGTGKTLALHFLLEELSNSFEPVFINVTTLEFPEILQLILRKLGVKISPGASTAELLDQFESTLKDFRKKGRKILLIIDEAQNLSSDILESTRLLLNLAQPGGQALQLVLSGQLGLLETLKRPDMRQLKQRIRVEYKLEYLSRSELEAYVNHRLKIAGCERELFSNGALDRIFQLSKGVPRVVNHLANNSLLSAYLEEKSTVAKKHVEEIKVGSGPFIPTEEDAKAIAKGGHSGKAEKRKEEKSEPNESDPEGHPYQPMASRRRRSAAPVLATIVVLVLVITGYLTYPQWSPVLLDSGDSPTSGPQEPDRSAPSTLTEAEQVAAHSEENPGPAVEETELSRAVMDSGQSSPPVKLIAEETELAKTRPAEDSEPEPLPAGPVDTASEEISASYLVHVASFGDALRATSLQGQLQDAGVASAVEETSSNGRVWHRVLVGPFQDRDRARSVTDSLKADGTIFYTRIITRRGDMEF